MNIYKFTIILLITFFTCLNNYAQFKWPNGAKAAVCLTYDDGLDCHLDVAAPQLDEAGFKGTFFCPGNSESLYKRMDEWRTLAKNGHELGNHTLFHPCLGNKPGREWVKPEYDLSNYSLLQITDELRTANTLLKAVDNNTKRSYAYTCGDYTAGGVDFLGEIRKLFFAARNDGPIPENMDNFDIHLTPSWCVNSHPASDLITYAEEAREKGTIAIFMFHSVEGNYLNVSADDHQELLKYLKEHNNDYYVATFKEVMGYIKSMDNR